MFLNEKNSTGFFILSLFFLLLLFFVLMPCVHIGKEDIRKSPHALLRLIDFSIFHSVLTLKMNRTRRSLSFFIQSSLHSRLFLSVLCCFSPEASHPFPLSSLNIDPSFGDSPFVFFSNVNVKSTKPR